MENWINLDLLNSKQELIHLGTLRRQMIVCVANQPWALKQ
jgi:hypothetical protein